jgi:hypothetical protein
MGDKPDLERGIYRVTLTLLPGQTRHIVENDFIFRDNELLLVLEWGGPKTNQFPLVTLKLDPERLKESPSMAGYFVYDGDLVDPRTVQ